VHWEGNHNLHRTVQRIKAPGRRAGVAINPATPACLPSSGKNSPGSRPDAGHDGESGLRASALFAINFAQNPAVAQMIDQIKPDCELEVDRAIDEATAPMVVTAGANLLVAGTLVFGTEKSVAAAMDRCVTQ